MALILLFKKYRDFFVFNANLIPCKKRANEYKFEFYLRIRKIIIKKAKL